jgi:carotenoid cleavage dioxygenase
VIFDVHFSRRDILKGLGFGGAALLGSPLISACTGAGREGDPDPGPTPDAPWWLRGNYRPVSDEIEVLDLPVTGAIPPELDGLYVRNGSNPASGTAGHWFIGDGMLHGVRLTGGRAAWYRNRYVQTVLRTRGGPGGPPGGASNASNVSLVEHASRLLSLGEVGFPYAIDPADLSTRGVFDFTGRLTTAMTAHPKIDPETGTLYFFGYGFIPPYLTYHVADAAGNLVRSEVVEVPGPAMMHDFAITDRHAIFMDMPIVFDLQMALAGSGFPYAWKPDYGARIGVMPLEGGNADVRWFDVDLCYVFHTLNAYTEDAAPDVVVLDAVRHPSLWERGPDDFTSRPQLYRWRLDLATGRVAGEVIDDRRIEFPQVDRRRIGRTHRYGYALELGAPGDAEDGPGTMRALVKYDHQTGARVRHDFGGLEAGEVIFVPADAARSGEDEGWLMTYAYDPARDASDLVILDATDVARAPVARVPLPRRVPYGFHGVWVAAPG